jgi:hypothetical protein
LLIFTAKVAVSESSTGDPTSTPMTIGQSSNPSLTHGSPHFNNRSPSQRTANNPVFVLVTNFSWSIFCSFNFIPYATCLLLVYTKKHSGMVVRQLQLLPGVRFSGHSEMVLGVKVSASVVVLRSIPLRHIPDTVHKWGQKYSNVTISGMIIILLI